MDSIKISALGLMKDESIVNGFDKNIGIGFNENIVNVFDKKYSPCYFTEIIRNVCNNSHNKPLTTN